MYCNYGDKNFFEHGRLVNTEHSDTVFDVLYCEPYPDEEGKYQFAELNVDTEDSWIDRNAVLSYSGITEREAKENPALYAVACIDYYGPENFGASSCYAYNWMDMEKESILDILKHRLIAWDEVIAE